MIRLGFMGGRMFPDNGIRLNIEGFLQFCGSCTIGNNSGIVVGKEGKLTIGDGFIGSSSITLICYKQIEFGDQCILGYDTIIQDTDFHPLFNIDSNSFVKGYGSISIGKGNWFSQGCLVSKSVHTPDFCIFAARSIVSAKGEFEPYFIHAGFPVKPISGHYKLCPENYIITDYSQD